MNLHNYNMLQSTAVNGYSQRSTAVGRPQHYHLQMRVVPIYRNYIRRQAQAVHERGDDENWRHSLLPGRLVVQLVVVLVEVELEWVAVEEVPPQNGFGVFKQVALLALLDFLEDVGMTVNVSKNFTQRFRCDLIGVSPFDVDHR